MGADNRLLSNYIEKTFLVLNSNPQIGIAYTDYAFFGSKARMKYEKMSDDLKGGVVDGYYYKICFPEFSDDNELKAELDKRNFIHGSSLFKRKAFNEVGGYKKTNKAEDYNLFHRIVNSGWLAAKAQTNLEYRQHSASQANNLSVLNNKLLFYKNAYEQVLKDKKNLENSKGFKYYLKMKKGFTFIKANLKKPKKIAKKIMKAFK